MASVELRGLTKRYGEVAVVDDVSLTIEHGRLVCLLGPSGCGKTTTLRLIAGFVEPSAGEIRVGDRAGAFRIIYVATFPDAVYVLHAFQKKTRPTAKRDVDLAASRLRERFARRR